MSTTSPRKVAETEVAPEQESSSTRDRVTQTSASGDKQRYQFFEGEEITAELASRRQRLQSIPVVAGTRFAEIGKSKGMYGQVQAPAQK